MKITHISPCYVDFEKGTGGVANVIRELATHQSAMGHEVRILDTDSLLGKLVSEAGTQFHGQIEHVTFTQPTNSQIIKYQKRFSSRFVSLAENRNHAIHVHTCFGPFTDAASRALNRLRIPFFFSAHGKLSPGMVDHRRLIKKLWWRLVAYPGLRGANAIPMSANEVDYFATAGLPRITEIVPNGVAPLTDDYLASLERPIASPFLLYFGYLDPRKQPILLAKAFAASQAAKTHKLVLAGPDAYDHQSEIEAAVKRLGIDEQVIFTGGIYGEDKWPWIRHARCMCLPSKGEGQPLVLLESFTAGTPVICSKLCNVSVGKCGQVLDSNNPLEWAKAIDRLVTGDEATQRQYAREFGKSFEWPRITSRMIDCYKTLL